MTKKPKAKPRPRLTDKEIDAIYKSVSNKDGLLYHVANAVKFR